MFCWSRVSGPRRRVPPNFEWARWAGKTNFDSINEQASAVTTTAGIARISRPKAPGKRNMGAKAAIVVSTPKITGVVISCVPRMAPSRAPHFLLMTMNVFTGHNRIVDQDAEHQDKRKEGEHVDRHIPGRHHKKRAE